MKLNTFSEIASCIMHDKNSLSFVNMKDVWGSWNAILQKIQQILENMIKRFLIYDFSCYHSMGGQTFYQIPHQPKMLMPNFLT